MSLNADRYFTYDSKELKRIAAVIRKMGEEASAQAREATGFSVDYAVREIKNAAGGAPAAKQAQRIAQGITISKTSVVGEFGIGYARQKFSGGATTQINYGREKGKGILAGVEFGARRLPNFPARSPRFGIRGNAGYFIYPTLRRIQPQIIKKWEESFQSIIKEWSK